MKIEPNRSELRAKIAKAVERGVRALLESLPVTDRSFPEGMREKRAPSEELLRENIAESFVSFRRKLLNRGQWSDIVELLAGERYRELVEREIRRQLRLTPDTSQMPLPGFEHVPLFFRISKAQTPVRSVTVAVFLSHADRYEKRAKENSERRQETLRLAELLRDQPRELTVSEALGRATGEEPAKIERKHA